MIRVIAAPQRTISTRSLAVLGVAVALAIIAGGLVGTGRVTPTLVLGLLLVPFGLAAILLALRQPSLGLALLPLIGAAVPLSIGTGSQSQVFAVLAFAAVLLALGLVRAIRSASWSTGAVITLPAVSLVIVWVVAYLWGRVERDPLVTEWPTFWTAQLGGLAIVIVSVGVLLLAMHTSWERPWAVIATVGLLICGLVALAIYFAGVDAAVTFRGIPVIETLGLFTMWVVALALGQALINDRLPLVVRLALGAFAAGWLYKALVLQTWWFSGWLPTLVATCAVLFFCSKRLFLAVAAIGGIVGIFRFQAIYDIVWGTTVDKGDLSRIDIWRQSLSLLQDHLLLGTGPAGYAVYFQSVYAGSAFSMSTHNNYMDVLLETGLIGGLVFLWLLVAIIYTGWQARQRWRTGFRGAFAQSAFAGLLATIVAMSQGDWFLPFVYNVGIGGFRYTIHSWVFVGLLLGLAFARRDTQRRTS